jgi:DNA-binding NtrC family response regulator
MEEKRTAGQVVGVDDAREKNGSRFIGNSPAFQAIINTIDTIAWRESSVIIVGETGTGKEGGDVFFQ